MKPLWNGGKTLMAATLLLTSFGAIAVTPSFGEEVRSEAVAGVRRPMRINGSVVCSDCSLEEARQAQPRERGFYQFAHKNGQLVFQVTAVNQPTRFHALTWPPRLWLRASDAVLRQLTAEETLFKPISITGLLSPTRTLDVMEVEISEDANDTTAKEAVSENSQFPRDHPTPVSSSSTGGANDSKGKLIVGQFPSASGFAPFVRDDTMTRSEYHQAVMRSHKENLVNLGGGW